MSKNPLSSFVQSSTSKMESDYNLLRERAKQDPGSAGDNGENNWAELLKNWLPAKYEIVTKGQIRSGNGELSPQIDILVISDYYPKALLKEKEFLSAGVVAAFECKLTLDSEGIQQAVKNASLIQRNFFPKRSGTLFKDLNNRFIYGLLAHSHDWKKSRSKPINNINKSLKKNSEKFAIHPCEIIDLVCVSDLATWMVVKGINRGFEAKPDWFNTNDPTHQSLAEKHVYCKLLASRLNNESNRPHYPIGSLITSLLGRIAWEDPILREMFKFFMYSDIAFQKAEGCQYKFPIDILSSDVLDKALNNLGCVDFQIQEWSEWNNSFSGMTNFS